MASKSCQFCGQVLEGLNHETTMTQNAHDGCCEKRGLTGRPVRRVRGRLAQEAGSLARVEVESDRAVRNAAQEWGVQKRLPNFCWMVAPVQEQRVFVEA